MHSMPPTRLLGYHSSRERPAALTAIALHLRVLVRRYAIDRRIATGCRVGDSAELQLRAVQLTGDEERRRLARTLVDVVAQAERRTCRGPLSAALPVCRTPVLLWRDSLLAIARRVQDGTLTPTALARLRLLLTDGAGPLFNPTSERLMSDVVAWIEDAS